MEVLTLVDLGPLLVPVVIRHARLDLAGYAGAGGVDHSAVLRRCRDCGRDEAGPCLGHSRGACRRRTSSSWRSAVMATGRAGGSAPSS